MMAMLKMGLTATAVELLTAICPVCALRGGVSGEVRVLTSLAYVGVRMPKFRTANEEDTVNEASTTFGAGLILQHLCI